MFGRSVSSVEIGFAFCEVGFPAVNERSHLLPQRETSISCERHTVDADNVPRRCTKGLHSTPALGSYESRMQSTDYIQMTLYLRLPYESCFQKQISILFLLYKISNFCVFTTFFFWFQRIVFIR